MLVYVFIKPTYPTSDVTTFAESAVYILYIFANNFGTKRDSLSRRAFLTVWTVSFREVISKLSDVRNDGWGFPLSVNIIFLSGI